MNTYKITKTGKWHNGIELFNLTLNGCKILSDASHPQCKLKALKEGKENDKYICGGGFESTIKKQRAHALKHGGLYQK